MLAKYWMTLLVFTVFPAPDSPLRRKTNMWTEHAMKTEEKLLFKLDSDMTSWITYVIRTDWFSLSVRFKTIFSVRTFFYVWSAALKMTCTKNWTYLPACTGRHCQKWSRCEEELHSSSFPCRHWPLPDRTLAATCRGWQSHRTVLSRSVDKDTWQVYFYWTGRLTQWKD